jgi:hypothetical protein
LSAAPSGAAEFFVAAAPPFRPFLRRAPDFTPIAACWDPANGQKSDRAGARVIDRRQRLAMRGSVLSCAAMLWSGLLRPAIASSHDEIVEACRQSVGPPIVMECVGGRRRDDTNVLGQAVDEFNGDNFDHGPLGFVGGDYIALWTTGGRP